MGGGKQAVNGELFSDTVDPAIRATVRAIRPRRGRTFRTVSFRQIPGGKEGLVWREASMDDSHNWTVEEITTVANFLEDHDTFHIAEENKVILHNACFFDALHNCAKFEFSAPGFGWPPEGLSRENLGPTHWAAFAQAENIPCDTLGMPHPAAHGRTLTQGKFAPEARALARNATDNLPKPSEIKTVFDNVSAGAGAYLPVPASEIPMGALKAASETKKILTKIIGNMEEVETALRRCATDFGYVSYAHPVALLLAASVVFSSVFLIDDMRSGGFPRLCFHARLGTLKKNMDKFPPAGPFNKNILQQFVKEAEVGFYALQLQASYRASIKKGKLDGKIERREKQLFEAGKRHGMNDADLEHLRQTLLAKPESGAFRGRLFGNLYQKIDQIKTFQKETTFDLLALPAPGAPRS